jgi:hypothetical protein
MMLSPERGEEGLGQYMLVEVVQDGSRRGIQMRQAKNRFIMTAIASYFSSQKVNNCPKAELWRGA